MTVFFRFIQNNKVILPALFLIFVFLLPTQFGKHFWPDFSFISGLRIDYLSPTLYITDLIILGFTFFSLLQFGKNVLPPRKIIFVYLFLAIGIFLSKNPLSGWYALAKFTEYLFFGFSLKTYFSLLKNWLFVVIPLSASIILESVLGLWQFSIQSSVGGIFYLFGERTFTSQTPGIANTSLGGQLVLRPYATFSHPNVFAGFLVLGMMLLVSLMPIVQTKAGKIISICAICIGTMALLTTLSRAAIFLWIVFLLFLFFKNNFLSKIQILLGALALILSMLFLFPFLRLRFFDASIFGETTMQRLLLLQTAWKMIVSHPVFGVGFANFLNELPLLVNQSPHVLLLQPVHNVFFLAAAETGIIGLVLVLALVSLVIIKLKILDKNANRNNKPSINYPAFIFFGILFLGQFDHYFLTLQQGQLLLTFLLSFVWSHSTKKNKHATML